MQKQKKPKMHCNICKKKIKFGVICNKCSEMLGEGYEVDEILRHYRNEK